MSRVIIIEDDTELRDSLVDYLGACGHDVAGAADFFQFHALMDKQSFDVALVDVNLPHINGLRISAELANRADGIAIIVMTVRGGLDDRVAGYNAGADLYMVKPVDPEELAAAITSITQKRSRPAAATVTQAIEPWQIRHSSYSLSSPDGTQIPLTRREMQLLEEFIRRVGEIVPRHDILLALGYDVKDYESRALDAAISRLRSKVQAACRQTLPLQTVQNSGYVFSAPLVME